MKLLKLTLLLFSLTLLVACVTINIYFPAAQAEEAAERIVDDILGEKAPSDDKDARLEIRDEERFALALLNFLVPAAEAAQPDFNVNTPKIRSLQASMKKRNSSLSRYYGSGAIGFTKDALISLRAPSAVPLKERNRAKQLVSEDNRDRNALYQAIADANGHPEWEPQVRATFARTWADKAAKGWWYQDSKGRWKQK